MSSCIKHKLGCCLLSPQITVFMIVMIDDHSRHFQILSVIDHCASIRYAHNSKAWSCVASLAPRDTCYFIKIDNSKRALANKDKKKSNKEMKSNTAGNKSKSFVSRIREGIADLGNVDTAAI